MKVILIRLAFLLISMVFITVGCSQCNYEEVMRIKSPNGKVEAVHVRGNCGATTSYTENVFIVPVGGEIPDPKADYQRFLADHTDSLNLVWRESKVLEIHYNETRIFKFTHFLQSAEIDDFKYVVEIQLIPSKTDF